MWKLGWKNKMGYSDLINGTVMELQGLPEYLVQTGQQVSRIVTTTNGRMFFHSGSSNGAEAIGIYTSTDGIHWSIFNDGITGQNDGLSQGSLAVDGNRVFMATHDGKVWMYDDGMTQTRYPVSPDLEGMLTAIPNPATTSISFKDLTGQVFNWREIFITNTLGNEPSLVIRNVEPSLPVRIEDLAPGCYLVSIRGIDDLLYYSRFIKM